MFLIKLLPVAALAVGVSLWDFPQARPTFLYLEQAEVTTPDFLTSACPNWELIPGLTLTYSSTVPTKALVRLELSTNVTAPSTRTEGFILVNGTLVGTNDFVVSNSGPGQQTGATEALIVLPPGTWTFTAAMQPNATCGGTAQIANKQAHLTVLAIG